MSTDQIAQSVHQRLLNIRDTTGEELNRLLVRYGLERLMYRIEAAGYAETFVLKGAMLFLTWDSVPGRPTRDIDLMGYGDPSHEQVRGIFEEVCTVKVVADGMRFEANSVILADIRDDQEYRGVRVRLHGFLGNARIPIQVDIGYGDATTPEPELINYPTILNFPAPRLRAYHPATVVAEKINAMVVLGNMNSRMKDFYDVYVILRHLSVDDALLAEAIYETFSRRNVEIPDGMPVCLTADFYDDELKQIQWRAFISRSVIASSDLCLADVVNYLRSRLAPVLRELSSRMRRRTHG